MTYTPIRELKVGLNFGSGVIPVGRLAMRDYKIYFEYDAEFIKNGLDISPLKLPLTRGLKEFDDEFFDKLPGVFHDSLPDGWGRLLFDRSLRSKGVMPKEVTALDRLAYVGSTGMGALVYEPDHDQHDNGSDINLDILASQVEDVLNGESGEVLTELMNVNGSPGGARPKAVIGVSTDKSHIIHGKSNLPEGYEHWLVKFPAYGDELDAGAVEYVYSLMAKEAGIDMAECHLFKAKKGAGYFATKRFDRDGENRLHMHTACGLLHSSFRTPSLDYEDLLALTHRLTQDIREVKKMFRLAVFNVLSHNQDDHSKNFSFLMNEQGEWKLSPAYDLTFSTVFGDEQSTTVLGKGKNITDADFLKLAQIVGLEESFAIEVLGQTKQALFKWKTLASEYGVRKETVKLVRDGF